MQKKIARTVEKNSEKLLTLSELSIIILTEPVRPSSMQPSSIKTMKIMRKLFGLINFLMNLNLL